MINDIIKDLNESKAHEVVYECKDVPSARVTRRNWAQQLSRRGLQSKVFLEQSSNIIKACFIGVSHIDIVDDTQPAPKENKKPDRGAFLDKQATKEPPGTMEDLRREANEASRLHMSYGQYQVMKQREWENRHGFGFGHAGIR